LAFLLPHAFMCNESLQITQALAIADPPHNLLQGVRN
jgi:hypothetical protein